jgi:cell division initiation protein
MEITPIDIQQFQFKSRFMGYDKAGVDQFLEKVADQLESLHRENQELKETLARTRQTLEEMRQTESTLKEALLTTQQVTDGLRENARKEAELLIEDARLKAGKIVRQAEERRIELVHQVQEINRQKLIFETSLESLIERHQRMLAETDWPEIPEALMVVDKRPSEETPAEEEILTPEEEIPELEEVEEETEGESEATKEFRQEWDV